MFDEEQIISGCKRGERKFQEALYQHFVKRMMVVAMRYTKGTLEAEDVLQESFIKVFDNIDKLKNAGALHSWMKKIVVNTALSHQRSKLYLYPMVDVETLGNDSDFDYSLSDFELDDLLNMVQSLPTGCRVTFNLYAIEGYKHREIATMLGISENTSKSQYARAKSLLQAKIGNNESMNYGK